MQVAAWILVFGIGCLAQYWIQNDAVSIGLILYIAAGTMVYLLFTRRRDEFEFDDGLPYEAPSKQNDLSCRLSERGHPCPHHSAQNDISWRPFFIGLILAIAAIWFIRKASLIGFRLEVAAWDMTQVQYRKPPHAYLARYVWIGFILFTLYSIRRPFLLFLRNQSRKVFIIIGLLLLLCFSLGVYRLTSVPITVHGDEGMVGVHARKLMNGNIETFFSVSWYAIPQFFYFIPACGLYCFGDNLFGLRMSTVVMGLLTIIPFFFLVRSFWGTFAAVLSSLLLISNVVFIHLMHCGVHYIQSIFFAVAVLCLWVFTNRTRSLAVCTASGLLLGFSLLSYQANHILPILWLMSQIWLLVFQRIRFSWFLTSIGLPFFIAGLVIAPLVVHDLTVSERTDIFAVRANSVGIWNSENFDHQNDVYQAGGDTALVWMKQFERSFLAPILYLDTSSQYGGSMPFLNPISAVFFLFGSIIAGYRFYEVRRAIPFLWIGGILFAGGFLTIDTPFYPRLTGCTGLFFVQIGGIFSDLIHAQWKKRSQYTLMLISLVIIMLVGMRINVRYYFETYAENISPKSVHYKQTRMAYFVAERGPKAFTYCFPGNHFSFGSGSVQFLAKDCLGRNTKKLPSKLISRPLTVVLDARHEEKADEIHKRLPTAILRRHYSKYGELLFISISRD